MECLTTASRVFSLILGLPDNDSWLEDRRISLAWRALTWKRRSHSGLFYRQIDEPLQQAVLNIHTPIQVELPLSCDVAIEGHITPWLKTAST